MNRTALVARVQDKLPFKAQIMICPAAEVLDLASRDPFPRNPRDRRARRFLSVMEKSPKTVSHFPLLRPERGPWEVMLVGRAGRYVLSLWRRLGRNILYPNGVVEKQFEAAATTRSWNTICAVGKILNEPPAASLRVDQGRRTRRGLDRD
jgi:uncharacterized protein (DUF1697 family)